MKLPLAPARLTLADLARRIARLPAQPPLTCKFERALAALGLWSGGSHASQRDHWQSWLANHQRRKNRRTAAFVFNHIECAPMLIWLAESLGVPKARVAEARRAALAAGKNFASQCAAIRKVIPWKRIADRLGSRAA